MSFLSKVFGGGNIFGAVLNIASMFFPPLQIANALSNMLTQAISQVAKGLVQYAVQELGMPKFMGNIANQLIDKVTGGLQKDVQEGAQEAAHETFRDDVQDLSNIWLNNAKDNLKKIAKSEGGSSTAGKSWYVKLAIALGQALNSQADKMEALTEKVNKTFSANGKEINNKQKNFEGLQELQAEAQVMNILANTVSQTVSKIGDALNTAARKA